METVTNFMDGLTEIDVAAQLNSSQLGQTGPNIASDCVEIPYTKPRGCDDPKTLLVTKETRLLVEEVVYIGVIPLLAMVGVTVNVLNIAVFVKQGLGDRVRLSLFSLSLTDLLVLTSLFIQKLNRILSLFIGRKRAERIWELPIVRYKLWGVPAGFQLASMFISIVIAVDRCVCVTWPLRAARMFSARVTGLVILVFGVIIFAARQFVAFKYDVACVYFAGKETTFFTLFPSELYKNNPVVMDTLDSFVLASLIPTVCLLITAAATTITAITLKRASAWRASSAGSTGADIVKQKERALTSMLIAISCVYITCVSPGMLEPWCRFFVPEFNPWGKLCNLMMTVETLMHVALAINSSVNFFVYYTMGSSFRQTLHQLLPFVERCSPKKPTGTENSKDQQ